MISTHWDMPEGYVPSMYCVECGKDFSKEEYFDRHRTGVHEYTYSEGLKFDPPREDGRRCLDDEELLAIGMRPMTEDEMNDMRRHRHRVGFGIEMWFDPKRLESTRKSFNHLT